jgi:methyl-accepting chemotaxis protein
MRARFLQIAETVSQYEQALDRVVQANKAATDSPAASAAIAEYEDVADNLHDSAEDGELAGHDASQSSLESIERTSRKSVNLVVGISALGLALGVLVSYLLARAILIPVKHLKDVAENVSMGNLNVSVKRYSDDEIGDLADSFSRMVTAVKFFRSEAEADRVPAVAEVGSR